MNECDFCKKVTARVYPEDVEYCTCRSSPQQEGEFSELDHAAVTLFAIHKTGATDKVIDERFTSVLKIFQNRILLQVTKRIEEKVRKLNEIDHEAKGYEILDAWKGEVCCMADAVGGGYECAVNDVLNLLREE